MNNVRAAAALAALDHEDRLKVFRLLVRARPEGLNVGDIGRHTGRAPSTLAHHPGTLVSAGLVAQEKAGREVINRAAYDEMRRVLTYVEAECCAGVVRGAARRDPIPLFLT